MESNHQTATEKEIGDQNPLPTAALEPPLVIASLSLSLSTILPLFQPKIPSLLSPPQPNKVKGPTQASSLTHLSLSTTTRVTFLIKSVSDLRKNLQARGSDLVVRMGKPEMVLVELAKAVGADVVYAHKSITSVCLL